MKTTKLILAGTLLAFAGVFTSRAQSDTTTSNSSYRAADDYGARSGDIEFTLGGVGASNKALNNSAGGVGVSLGYFLTDGLEISVRQSGAYSNGTGSGGANYDGSTFIAIDEHLGTGRFRPFVGINAGRLYGDTTNDTWAAGIEGGLKLYVQPKTFIFALVNYAWVIDDSENPTDKFNDGGFLLFAGVGFNF
ncbi:MAG TPA: hypothetical protein VK968_14500 [Roseimicrobium sp.]|nr:hypothetical protein [Roseimicrobium sp.]